MPQFLIRPEDHDPAAAAAVVRGDEARHLARVLRARAGDPVLLFDGAGNRWSGTAQTVGHDAVVVAELTSLAAAEPRGEVWLLAGLLKGERWEWLLEKATELGATRILPLLAAHSVARPGDARAEGKLARWRTQLLAAAKQCERGRLPTLVSPASVEDALAALGAPQPDEARYALLARSDAPQLSPPEAAARILLAVGPEGGWAPEEEGALAAAGFAPASLGPRILRGETAALAALARLRN